MSTPLVSVVIPTRNRPQETLECVQSVRAQDYPNIEIVVVDGNSTDNTREVVSPVADLVIKFSEIGDHRCAQRNLGVEKAKGKYVLVIDSDMTLSTSVIRECVEKFESEENIAGIIIPEESFGIGFWAQCKALEKKFYQGVDWMEAARFYKKDLYISLGGYNPELTSGEDWDLSQRAGEHGQIARIQSYISHNEGQITLWGTMKKKYYYASKFSKYASTTKSKNIGSQTNIFQRYVIFFKKPSFIIQHPLLWTGMIVMKTGEFGAGGVGIIKNYI